MNHNTILHIDSSARKTDSLSRQASHLVSQILAQKNTELRVNYKDLAKGLPLIDEAWINANFTAEDQRNEAAKKTLSFSDEMVLELQNAEYIVIGVPTYNFNIPTYLKAWVDLIARAGLTFKYTKNGPVGLLKNKKAYLIVASGGVSIGTNTDFVSQYLTRIMAFVGITDVTVIDATKVKLEEITDSSMETLIK